MEQRVKQRLVGAVVLVALAIIFIPMLLTGPVDRESTDVPMEIPPQPTLTTPPGVAATLEDEVSTQPELLTPSTPVETPTQPETVEAPGEPADAGLTPPPVVAADEPAVKAPSRTPSELASWTVQVGSFGAESNAMGLRDRLRKKGYPAYVDSIKGSAKVFYRVRIGPMIQRAEAELIQTKLAKQEQIKSLVVPHP